ncbi:MAG TPA: cyclase family protein [Acidimicrobiia bacterium]|nr:cyclase family protein [Acidimicrobiia bacterium]
MSVRPRYRELPDGCAWHLLDPDVGSLSSLTPERARTAATLVRRGIRFPLDLPLDVPDPPFFGRQAMRHEVFNLRANVLDDKLDNFFPQASTQWDGLGHIAHSNGFFGGRTADQVRAAPGILAWSEDGIVGRGVLLDVARQRPIPGDEPFVVTPALLDETAAAQGVEVQAGDVCCVRVGWLSWYRDLDAAGRAAVSTASRSFEDLRTPGLGPGPDLAAWLWDHEVAALAVDNPAVEPLPVSAALPHGGGFDDTVHARVLALLGIPLGEFFDLDALAEDCARRAIYEFLFTSAPLRLPGGIGSPPNALAIT